MAKYYYDARYINITLKKKIYLRLNNGYSIPGQLNKKLSIQRIELFTVKRRIGRLIYELELSPVMKIHLVVLVT